MYKFYEDDKKEKYEGRYWNCGGTDICIIASITKGIDWAAYIGAENWSNSEDLALIYTADYGCKLSEEDARHIFPDIELPYRR